MNSKIKKPKAVRITISPTSQERRANKESLESLLDEAIETIFPHISKYPREVEKERLILIRKAVRAVTRAIIREKSAPMPLEVYFSPRFTHLLN